MARWQDDPSFLKETRKRLGLTQSELAAKAGVKRSLVSDVELGRQRLTEDGQNSIWRALANAEAALKSKQLVPLLLIDPSLPAYQAAKAESDASLSGNFHRHVAATEDRLQTMESLIANQDKLIAILTELVALHEGQSEEKDVKIAELKGQVTERDATIAKIRNLYELEKELAVKGAEAEELREKLNASVGSGRVLLEGVGSRRRPQDR